MRSNNGRRFAQLGLCATCLVLTSSLGIIVAQAFNADASSTAGNEDSVQVDVRTASSMTTPSGRISTVMPITLSAASHSSDAQ